MTGPQNPDPQSRLQGDPTDGGLSGGTPAVITTAQLIEDQNRSMDYALDKVGSLTLGLTVWLSDIESDGAGRGQDASDRSRLLGRMVDQLLTMSTLVELSLRQRREQGDPTTAWVLLEQARQQLGWAARTAGALEGTVPEEATIVSDPEDNVVCADEEPLSTSLVLEYLIQRDLIPRAEYAEESMDMGEGIGVIPDPRPETPFELVPLQMLSAAAMRCGAVISDATPRTLVDRMAYGTYVATLLTEAAEVLSEQGRAAGQHQLQRFAEVGREAGNMMLRATPGPLEVFPPREGGAAA